MNFSWLIAVFWKKIEVHNVSIDSIPQLYYIYRLLRIWYEILLYIEQNPPTLNKNSVTSNQTLETLATLHFSYYGPSIYDHGPNSQ